MTENRRLLAAVYAAARDSGNAAVAAQCLDLLTQAGFPPPDDPAPTPATLRTLLDRRPGAHPKIRELGYEVLRGSPEIPCGNVPGKEQGNNGR